MSASHALTPTLSRGYTGEGVKTQTIAGRADLPISLRMRYAVCISVGPDAADQRRLRTLVAGLFRHEPAVSLLVIADASADDAASGLRELVPPTCQGVRLDCRAAAGGACSPLANRLMGLRYLADRDDVDACVQLGLQSLVIAPFARQLTRALTARTGIGLVGRLCEDAADRIPLRLAMTIPPVVARRPRRWSIGRQRAANAGPDLRRLARLAVGVESATHCTSAAYALTRPAVAGLEAAGLLAHDWPAHADEGRLVSAMVLAAGWTAADLSAAGEVFGVAPVGLRGSPRELAEEGYAIIGDVTNDTHHSEREITAYFDGEAVEYEDDADAIADNAVAA